MGSMQKLLDTANKLNLLGDLSKKQTNRVEEAVDALKTLQTTNRRKKYKLFLYKVLRDAGPGAVLLCAIALGQVYITELKDGERANLCNQIRPEGIYKNIHALATQYGIPASVKDVQSSLPEVFGSQDDPINEIRAQSTASLLSNDPDLPTAQEQRVIENATLPGITNVFDEFLCGAIRRVEGDLKAAVTMAFPLWGGLVHCLMSLDICERNVEQLAMALFGAKVKWAERVLHIVLNEGITVIIPNSEFTLKGVKDDAILEIFGTETYGAITENPVRRRELAEGKPATDCVSMIFTKNGAIINLSLGLEGGLQLQNKLYI